MVIYKGTKELKPEIASKILNDGEFMTKNIWKYSEALNNNLVRLLKEVSAFTLIDLVSHVPKHRKRALRAYYKDQEKIKEVLAQVDVNKYQWFKSTHNNLYDQDEQNALRELILFIASSDDKELSKQILIEIIPDIRGHFAAEKKFCQMQKNIIGSIDNQIIQEMSFDMRVLKSQYQNNGFLTSITDTIDDAPLRGHYYSIMTYVFMDEYVDKFKNYNLLIMQPNILKQIAIWALEKNQYYLLEHHRDLVEALAKQPSEEVHPVVIKMAKRMLPRKENGKSSRLKEFELAGMKFPIRKGDSLIQFLDSISKDLSAKKTALLFESAQKMAKSIKSRRTVLNSVDSVNPLVGLEDDPTELMSSEEQKQYYDIIDQAECLSDVENRIRRVSSALLSYTSTSGGLLEDVVYQPLTKDIWDDIESLMFIFKNEKKIITETIEKDFDFYFSETLDFKFEDGEIEELLDADNTYLILETSFFIYAVLIALFGNLDNLRKEINKKNNNKKIIEKQKKKEQAETTEEVLKLKKELVALKEQLSNKDQLLARKNAETKSLSETNRKLSKVNSRLLTLERKLKEIQKTNIELQMKKDQVIIY